MTKRLAVLVGAAVAALVLVMTGVATAQSATKATIRCDPGPPKKCEGTPRRDTITGSKRTDYIVALGGPDSVDGEGGADTVLGGKGDDLPGQGGGLEGGPGNDTVRGQSGADTVQDQVTADSDRLFGGRGRDLVDGADGDNRDTVDCGPAVDFFDADPGDKVNLGNCEKPF